MKIYEIIALEHVKAMIKLIKVWRVDDLRVDQAWGVYWIWGSHEEHKVWRLVLIV